MTRTVARTRIIGDELRVFPILAKSKAIVLEAKIESTPVRDDAALDGTLSVLRIH
jgi:hypothetical protein